MLINKILNFFLKRKKEFLKEDLDVQQKFYTKDFFIDKKFIIGDFTYGCPTVLFENNESNLHIGKFCSIANNVTIFLGGNHRSDFITTYPFNSISNSDFSAFSHIKGHPATKGDVFIGNDVWLGLNTTILSGVKIGNGAIIAANSVVTKNIESYEIWGGNPAKFIRKRFSDNQIAKLNQLNWWSWDIEKIKKNIQKLMSCEIEDFIRNHNS